AHTTRARMARPAEPPVAAPPRPPVGWRPQSLASAERTRCSRVLSSSLEGLGAIVPAKLCALTATQRRGANAPAALKVRTERRSPSSVLGLVHHERRVQRELDRS